MLLHLVFEFLDVTTSMLTSGIPFPVIPESAEIMNIVVPDMMQNALTGRMTAAAAADNAAVPPPIPAAGGVTWTIADVTSTALRNHPLILQSDAEVAAAVARKGQGCTSTSRPASGTPATRGTRAGLKGGAVALGCAAILLIGTSVWLNQRTTEKVQTPTEGANVQQTANVQPKNNGKLTPDEITEKATLMTSVYADIFHQLQASGLEAAQAQPAAATIFIQIGKYF